MGDLNAKVGKIKIGLSVGPRGLGERNEKIQTHGSEDYKTLDMDESWR